MTIPCYHRWLGTDQHYFFAHHGPRKKFQSAEKRNPLIFCFSLPLWKSSKPFLHTCRFPNQVQHSSSLNTPKSHPFPPAPYLPPGVISCCAKRAQMATFDKVLSCMSRGSLGRMKCFRRVIASSKHERLLTNMSYSTYSNSWQNPKLP